MDVFPAFALPIMSTLNLTSGGVVRSSCVAIVPKGCRECKVCTVTRRRSAVASELIQRLRPRDNPNAIASDVNKRRGSVGPATYVSHNIG